MYLQISCCFHGGAPKCQVTFRKRSLLFGRERKLTAEEQRAIGRYLYMERETMSGVTCVEPSLRSAYGTEVSRVNEL